MVRTGKTIRIAFTRTSATTNGQIARDPSLSPIRPMLQATNRRLPTGGVMPPMRRRQREHQPEVDGVVAVVRRHLGERVGEHDDHHHHVDHEPGGDDEAEHEEHRHRSGCW